MRIIILILIVAMLPLRVSAQEAELPAEKPDPLVILRSADEALGKLEVLTFKVHTYGVGPLATRSPETRASVQMRRASARDPIGWTFRVEGTARHAADVRRLLTAYDGREVRSVREHEKAVIEGTWESSADPMSDGAGWSVAWVVRWRELVSRPFGEGGRPWPAHYEGVSIIDGTTCDVIHVDYSETDDRNLFNGWWHIGREDRLPRRLELHLLDQRDGYFITDISELEPGAEVETARFAIATPEGYELRAAERPAQRTARGRRPAGVPFGELAPDWTLKDPEGREHTLSDYRGRLVIMDFWATWCGPCLRAMPGLQALHEKYAERGVVIFGINCWESGDPEAMMKEKGYTYTLLLEGDPVAAMYSVSGIPTFYVISPEGRVAHVAVGFDPQMEAKLEEIIDALLP
jgi:thiol-disulfide isomerase/thioredoxin